jgi:hypothetical protein
MAGALRLLEGRPLRQRDPYSCGSAVLVVARAIFDTDFARSLAASASDRFEQAQSVAHRASNRMWPRFLGTTPWGLARVLTVYSGRRYRWRPLRPRFVAPRKLEQAIEAVDGGWPVPVLIGNWIPRHWVLLTERSGDEMSCYEPSSGSIVDLSLDDLRAGRVARLGFPKLQAVALPLQSAERPVTT